MKGNLKYIRLNPYKINEMSILQIFHISYCEYFTLSVRDEWQGLCQEFFPNVKQYMPTMLQKQKAHHLLHLTECMEQFGPSSAFNAEW